MREQIEHPQAIALRSHAKLETGRADTRFTLAAALPGSFIPGGSLRTSKGRIWAGAGEILYIDAHDIAWPHIGLNDGGISSLKPRSIDRH